MLKTLQWVLLVLISTYYFYPRFTVHYGTRTRRGVAYAAFEPISDRLQFIQGGLTGISTAPLLLLLSKDITSEKNRLHIKHPFKYSAEWSGTSLPLLDISSAVKQADSTQLLLGGRKEGYRWVMGKWPDPILRRSADPVDESYFNSNALQKTCEILRNTAVAEGAVGLAAQQCGINAQIIYLDVPSYGMNTPNGMILINPQIENCSSEIDMIAWRERCLVLPPTFEATVLRDAWVDVSYNALEKMGRTQKNSTPRRFVRLYGEMARAIQHEMDHDRGILVTDHVGLEELESDLMRLIEQPGHEQRMKVAYSRRC